MTSLITLVIIVVLADIIMTIGIVGENNMEVFLIALLAGIIPIIFCLLYLVDEDSGAEIRDIEEREKFLEFLKEYYLLKRRK